MICIRLLQLLLVIVKGMKCIYYNDAKMCKKFQRTNIQKDMSDSEKLHLQDAHLNALYIKQFKSTV